jgi:hypothetical protein
MTGTDHCHFLVPSKERGWDTISVKVRLGLSD